LAAPDIILDASPARRLRRHQRHGGAPAHERAGACLVGRGKHLRRPLKTSPLDSMRTSPGPFADLTRNKHTQNFKQDLQQDFKIRGVLDVVIVFR
jgi:hypothetical protein